MTVMPENGKTCVTCLKVKNLDAFSRTARGGLSKRCIVCQAVARVHEVDGVMVKQCADCLKILPVDNFSKASRGRLMSYCRTCLAARQSKQRAPHRTGRQAYVEPTEKLCRGCQRVLPISQFYPRKERENGYRSRCVSCSSRTHEQWRSRNMGESRRRNLWSKYGITPNDYFDMLDRQDERCGICRGAESRNPRSPFFCVDHDHQTGKVRGLLCLPCNIMVGHFENQSVDPRALVAWMDKEPEFEHVVPLARRPTK